VFAAMRIFNRCLTAGVFLASTGWLQAHPGHAGHELTAGVYHGLWNALPAIVVLSVLGARVWLSRKD
jgi:hypothetical protein